MKYFLPDNYPVKFVAAGVHKLFLPCNYALSL